jgi:hypothetical protein
MDSNPDDHGPFAIIHLAVVEAHFSVKPDSDKICHGHGQPNGLKPEPSRSFKRPSGQLGPHAQVAGVLVNKDDELARLPIVVRNQGRVADDLFSSPGNNVYPYVQNVFYPLFAGFQILRRQALRSRLGREDAVHLHDERTVHGIAARDGISLAGFVRAGHRFVCEHVHVRAPFTLLEFLVS